MVHVLNWASSRIWYMVYGSNFMIHLALQAVCFFGLEGLLAARRFLRLICFVIRGLGGFSRSHDRAASVRPQVFFCQRQNLKNMLAS